MTKFSKFPKRIYIVVSSSKTQYYCKIYCDNDLRTLNLLCYTFEFPFQCFLTLSVAKDIIRSLSRCNVLTFVIEKSLFNFKNTQHRWIYILVSKTKFSLTTFMEIYYTGGDIIYWCTTVLRVCYHKTSTRVWDIY